MRVVAASIVALAALAGSAQATVLYTSGGFEAPTFTVGNIDGQGGFVTDPAAHTQHQVVGVTGAVNPAGGSQMVQLNAVASTRWSFPDISGLVGTRPVGEDWITCNFDIYAPAGQTSTATYGVLAYNAAFATVGGVRVRASDRAIIVTLDPDGPGAAAFGSYTLGLFAPADTWVNLGLAINVSTNALALYSGNTILFSGAATAQAGTAATISDFDLVSSSGAATTNVMYVDNYVVGSDNVAPAPGAAALLGLGGLVAARRRRS